MSSEEVEEMHFKATSKAITDEGRKALGTAAEKIAAFDLAINPGFKKVELKASKQKDNDLHPNLRKVNFRKI